MRLRHSCDGHIRPTARPSSLASPARTLARSIPPRSSAQRSGADYFFRFPGCRWKIRHDAFETSPTGKHHLMKCRRSGFLPRRCVVLCCY
ncbi:unnamed protein product [Zymoseptoria tritici ST99CH_3D1]|uniref:Uncharacterized protein n=1 Tax=Zymoseptoria tritici ST99CH_1E4 TaxID=1276532 RepID=A0A2H1G4M0_ZYMTR|nr:unnamed protein product [Zymoseptoria tritici ST99CH_1E4]SMR49700.1 unnamed protein product [Zymoseptoria tritici ST99CH_3D1]